MSKLNEFEGDLANLLKLAHQVNSETRDDECCVNQQNESRNDAENEVNYNGHHSRAIEKLPNNIGNAGPIAKKSRSNELDQSRYPCRYKAPPFYQHRHRQQHQWENPNNRFLLPPQCVPMKECQITREAIVAAYDQLESASLSPSNLSAF